MLVRLNDNYGLLNPSRQQNKFSNDFWGWLDEFNHSFDQYRSGYNQVSLCEDENKITAQFVLPGYNADSIDVEVIDDFLTVRAQREMPTLAEGKKYLHQERSFGNFEETIKLPAKVVATETVANYQNGILTVSMVRQAAEKAFSVKVNC